MDWLRSGRALWLAAPLVLGACDQDQAGRAEAEAQIARIAELQSGFNEARTQLAEAEASLATAEAALAATALADAEEAPPEPVDLRQGLSGEPAASAALLGVDGVILGVAEFYPAPSGVLLRLDARGLTPGFLGLHLHATGACDASGGFTSAGGHVQAHEGAHGLLNAEGPHVGDLTNLFVHAEGTGAGEFFAAGATLGAGPGGLLDGDGSALMIHEAADDHVTQPIGGAGARVACGVLTASTPD